MAGLWSLGARLLRAACCPSLSIWFCLAFLDTLPYAPYHWIILDHLGWLGEVLVRAWGMKAGLSPPREWVCVNIHTLPQCLTGFRCPGGDAEKHFAPHPSDRLYAGR